MFSVSEALRLRDVVGDKGFEGGGGGGGWC